MPFFSRGLEASTVNLLRVSGSSAQRARGISPSSSPSSSAACCPFRQLIASIPGLTDGAHPHRVCNSSPFWVCLQPFKPLKGLQLELGKGLSLQSTVMVGSNCLSSKAFVEAPRHACCNTACKLSPTACKFNFWLFAFLPEQLKPGCGSLQCATPSPTQIRCWCSGELSGKGAGRPGLRPK